MKLYERKEDARRKIALGGLIIKAGLDDESSAVLLGLLLDAKDRLLETEGTRTYWHMLGARAFEQD